MRFVLIIFCVIGVSSRLSAQNDSIKFYTTQRLVGEPPKIDGRGNDAAWGQVAWGGGDFLQRSPDAGAPASVQTKFKILYDDKNLYILFKNFDPEPDKIVSRMSRRDGFEGDQVEVNIDSYNDKRTAFSFSASVSGVKGDEYASNNGGNWDANWDPIWYLQTTIDADGWIAEMRIPLSQLRFADKPEHTWGLQIGTKVLQKSGAIKLAIYSAGCNGMGTLIWRVKGHYRDQASKTSGDPAIPGCENGNVSEGRRQSVCHGQIVRLRLLVLMRRLELPATLRST